ncbi:hypothetical protein SCLCIDRAFT_29646 [Scleroderma citrinum Foug A]|uniref:Uncharacterized protein n=1 Tax=Scleroderma citrinum Foug A TaxID=1036808 RepID=A0A0C2Z3C0_9AGAM|nr:hypothetical protein SCLCIDRAFT_29646 [Scleroderma citrinum Foug A]
MSSGNNTDGGNNGNGGNKVDWQRVTLPDLVEQVEDLLKVQIAKFNEQSRCQCDKLMKWAAEQEVQRKAKEERKKAKEERKKAEEEAKRVAEEEAKKKAEEDAQKRAEFQARWQADMERKAREKAEAKVVSEAMKACIAQKAAQGEKPKPKQCQAASQHAPNEEVQGWYPPCNRCRKSGDSKVCSLPDNTQMPTCNQCQKMKVKCHFEVLTAMMKRSASGKKCKESETLATVVVTSPQGGKKCKRTRRAVADAVSTEEIEEALGGFSVVGPLTQPDPVVQVLDRQLGEVIAAIDHNTRELAWLGGKMDSFAWEMKRMADHSNRKGKGKARPEETKEEEEKSDNREDKEEVDDMSDADAEGEDAEE